MPFGLMNALSTFQRLITKVLVGCEAFTAAYINDVLVFSQDEEQHQQHLRQVFHQLVKHNLACEAEEVQFLSSRNALLRPCVE